MPEGSEMPEGDGHKGSELPKGWFLVVVLHLPNLKLKTKVGRMGHGRIERGLGGELKAFLIGSSMGWDIL